MMPRSCAAERPCAICRSDLHRLAHRDGTAIQPLAQRLALQQLRDQVRRAVLHPNVVHGKNVGMIERGDGARFLLEAAHAIGIVRRWPGEEL